MFGMSVKESVSVVSVNKLISLSTHVVIWVHSALGILEFVDSDSHDSEDQEESAQDGVSYDVLLSFLGHRCNIAKLLTEKVYIRLQNLAEIVQGERLSVNGIQRRERSNFVFIGNERLVSSNNHVHGRILYHIEQVSWVRLHLDIVIRGLCCDFIWLVVNLNCTQFGLILSTVEAVVGLFEDGQIKGKTDIVSKVNASELIDCQVLTTDSLRISMSIGVDFDDALVVDF